MYDFTEEEIDEARANKPEYFTSPVNPSGDEPEGEEEEVDDDDLDDDEDVDDEDDVDDDDDEDEDVDFEDGIAVPITDETKEDDE